MNIAFAIETKLSLQLKKIRGNEKKTEMRKLKFRIKNMTFEIVSKFKD